MQVFGKPHWGFFITILNAFDIKVELPRTAESLLLVDCGLLKKFCVSFTLDIELFTAPDAVGD